MNHSHQDFGPRFATESSPAAGQNGGIRRGHQRTGTLLPRGRGARGRLKARKARINWTRGRGFGLLPREEARLQASRSRFLPLPFLNSEGGLAFIHPSFPGQYLKLTQRGTVSPRRIVIPVVVRGSCARKWAGQP